MCDLSTCCFGWLVASPPDCSAVFVCWATVCLLGKHPGRLAGSRCSAAAKPAPAGWPGLVHALAAFLRRLLAACRSVTVAPWLARCPLQDLGAEAFNQLVAKVPWVLLLDAHTHGCVAWLILPVVFASKASSHCHAPDTPAPLWLSGSCPRMPCCLRNAAYHSALAADLHVVLASCLNAGGRSWRRCTFWRWTRSGGPSLC